MRSLGNDGRAGADSGREYRRRSDSCFILLSGFLSNITWEYLLLELPYSHLHILSTPFLEGGGQIPGCKGTIVNPEITGEGDANRKKSFYGE